VTLFGLGFGMAAALAYARWADWRFATLGFALMIGWHVMDGLDGQLARATGKTSDTGRLLDGIADYATFIIVLSTIALTTERPYLVLALFWVGGAFHALQSAFYEAERETYIRRRNGRFHADPRPAAGGRAEQLYNRAEAWLGNRTRPFDRALAGADPVTRARLLGAWQPRAARILRRMSPLSANGRTLAIYIAVLAGNPLLYVFWEIAALSVIALAAGRALRQAEKLSAAFADHPTTGQDRVPNSPAES
ncbi:MAG: CDP-alcohol phosphatidyltransferase family protein, partial [Sandaracinobacteroides sp.]